MSAVLTPCVDDLAYIGAAGAQALALAAETAIQVYLQQQILEWQNNTDNIISDMRQELADRRMRMAEAILGHAAIGWAEEQAFVNEVMGTSSVDPAYGIAAVVDTTVEEAWGGADIGFDTAMRRLGLPGTTQCEDHRLSRGMAAVKTDLYAHQLRQAEARAVALNDRRFSRQNAVLAMGRGILQGAASMGALGAHRESVRNAVLGTINSAFQVAGYVVNRNFGNSAEQWNPRASNTAKIGSGSGVFHAPALSSNSITVNLNQSGSEFDANNSAIDYSTPSYDANANVG